MLKRFTAYLRGIETTTDGQAAGALLQFTAYLRGIETLYPTGVIAV